MLYFSYEVNPKGGTGMMIPQADILALMGSSIGKHVGVNAMKTSNDFSFATEGYLTSTTFGVLSLKDGYGEFSPSVHVDDISSFTINGEFYVVEYPEPDPEKTYYVYKVWSDGDVTLITDTRAVNAITAIENVLCEPVARVRGPFEYKGKDYHQFGPISNFGNSGYIAVEV